MEVAYWIHVQEHFRNLPNFNLFQAGRTMTVHVPITQVLTPTVVRQFASLRDEVYARYPPQ